MTEPRPPERAESCRPLRASDAERWRHAPTPSALEVCVQDDGTIRVALSPHPVLVTSDPTELRDMAALLTWVAERHGSRGVGAHTVHARTEPDEPAMGEAHA